MEKETTEALVRQTIKLGNSAGILLPKSWLGSEVKATLIEKPIDIKRDILKILGPYLDDIIGIYLTGSYARGEQKKGSDIDILVITETKNKIINVGKYHIIIIKLDNVIKNLEENIITIYPLIKEAKVILNKHLLNELKKVKVTPDKLRWHIETSKTALKIIKSLLDLEEKEEIVKSTAIIYSLVLRLREAYIVECLLKNKDYNTKNLIKLISKKIREETVKKSYAVYVAERDNKKIPYKIKLKDVKKLYEIVDKMISKQEMLLKHGKKRKKA